MELKNKQKSLAKAKPISTHNGRQLYKVVTVDGGPNQRNGSKLKYPLPANGKPGAWKNHIGHLSMCSSGLHLTTNPGNWLRNPTDRVFKAQYRGNMADDYSDKICCRSIRLMREVAIVKKRNGSVSVRAFTRAEKALHSKRVKNAKRIEALDAETYDRETALYKEQDKKINALRKELDASIRQVEIKTQTKIRELNIEARAKQVKLGAGKNGTLKLSFDK